MDLPREKSEHLSHDASLGGLVRRRSGTTKSSGASGHLRAIRTADLGLSGCRNVGWAGWLSGACRIGPRRQQATYPRHVSMALGLAPSHIGSVANCQGCLAIAPRPEGESLIRMARRLDGRTPESSVGHHSRGVADDPSPADLMVARGKALRWPSSSPVLLRPSGSRNETRLEPRMSVVGPR